MLLELHRPPTCRNTEEAEQALAAALARFLADTEAYHAAAAARQQPRLEQALADFAEEGA